MRKKTDIKLVSDNGRIRRTDPQEWEGSFIRGGLYSLPEKPLNFTRSYPGLFNDFAGQGLPLAEKPTFETLPKQPHISLSSAWANLDSCLEELDRAESKVQLRIVEERDLLGRPYYNFE